VRNEADQSLLAASAAQAAGTLTLHLLPLLVHLVSVAWGVSSLAAGSYAAALSIGQLAATLLLPAIAVSVSLSALIAAGGALLCASLAAIGAADAPLHAAWVTAGLGSGALIYASAKRVARDHRPVLAFSSRLAASLLVGGLATLALGLLHDRIGLRECFWTLALAIGVLTVAAIVIAPPARHGTRTATHGRAPMSAELVVGMLLLCALFAGQVGTIVLLVRRVVASGVTLSDVVLVMAGCKIVAAAVVVATARRGPAAAYAKLTAVLLAMTVGAMSLAGDVVTLTVALLSWELCLNRLSAMMQGTLARLSPAATGAWSSALLLGGAAAGPMLHGAALDHGLGALFVAFAMATAVAAGLWSSTRAAVPETR
jgi:hypothetical protein